MTVTPTRRSPIPAGMLAALTLVAGLEVCAFRPRNDLAAFIPASWVEASRAARHDAVSADVLFLGDSQVKGGLLPSAFESQSRLRAYNLATIGGQPAAALALLRQAIDSGARPRAVVVGFYPGLLAADSRINVRQWPDLLGPIGCLDLIRAAGDFPFAAPLLTRSLLPSLRRRDEIRAAALTLATGTPDAATTKALAYQRNWRLNSGAQALTPNPAFRDDPIPPPGEPGSAANRSGGHWRAKDEHLVHLRKLFTFAASQNISVFWLLPTNSPGLQSFRKTAGLDAAYLRLVTNLQREFSGLTVLDPNSLLTDPSVFSDACHLDHRGALTLTLVAADALAHRLASESVVINPHANWVGLVGRENGTRVAVKISETIDQSTQVMSTNSRARKIWR